MNEVPFGSTYVVIRECGTPVDHTRDERTLCLRSPYGADNVTNCQFFEVVGRGDLSEAYLYRCESAIGPKLASLGDNLYGIGMDVTAVFENARLGREITRYECIVAYYGSIPLGGRALLFGELEIACTSSTDEDGRIRLELRDDRVRWLDRRTGSALGGPSDKMLANTERRGDRRSAGHTQRRTHQAAPSQLSHGLVAAGGRTAVNRTGKRPGNQFLRCCGIAVGAPLIAVAAFVLWWWATLDREPQQNSVYEYSNWIADLSGKSAGEHVRPPTVRGLSDASAL